MFVIVKKAKNYKFLGLKLAKIVLKVFSFALKIDKTCDLVHMEGCSSVERLPIGSLNGRKAETKSKQNRNSDDLKKQAPS